MFDSIDEIFRGFKFDATDAPEWIKIVATRKSLSVGEIAGQFANLVSKGMEVRKAKRVILAMHGSLDLDAV